MEKNTEMEHELGWDDTIQREHNDFITLPEGDYNYVVESVDRGRHNGSEKLPPCNKAILKIRIEGIEGEVLLTHNLFLHSRVEGLLSAFFTSVGLKKKGESLRMNWQAVPGCRGRLKLGIRNYEKNGENRTINEVKQFYPKEASKYTAGKF